MLAENVVDVGCLSFKAATDLGTSRGWALYTAPVTGGLTEFSTVGCYSRGAYVCIQGHADLCAYILYVLTIDIQMMVSWKWECPQNGWFCCETYPFLQMDEVSQFWHAPKHTYVHSRLKYANPRMQTDKRTYKQTGRQRGRSHAHMHIHVHWIASMKAP